MTKNNHYFEPVDPKANFSKMEKKLLDGWYKKGVVKKYLVKNKTSKKRFSFIDGPITANNPMGIHHAWGRTYKDLWQRYKNMRGFKQRFQNGFDCQGLWVEVEVEKELGLKSKKDIENLIPGDAKKSIARFVELCKERVYKYADIQTEQSKRLGYFMDWDNSYYTLSDENNYMIWYFLKKCQDKGLIYKGRDSVPWCPRCGTAISQHEILTEDYRQLSHEAVFVGYEIEGRENEYLLIWTTTPWTLPANVAAAVDPKLDYALVSDPSSKNKYYLLYVAAKRMGLIAIKKVKGKELIGLNYKSPFDYLDRVKSSLGKYKHKVVSSDERILPVSEEEGTGIVHIATGAGTEDFALGKKEGLPTIEVIDEDASYLDGLGEFSGKNAKDNPRIIIDYLMNGGNLFKEEKYKHKYPVCWRCKTELVWRVVDEWYIAIDPVRENMKRVAKKIRWIPSFGLKREIDWLNNMHDWLISKKRYWGLALPIWECKDCGHFEVIGSREELRKKAVSGWESFNGHSPHRPWVDEVKIKCEKCGNIVERIPDVGNPWVDAGIVPYSTITAKNKGKLLYLHDRNEWEKWFPADFITESFPGQFKNWFYSMIAESTVLENKEPYKTVLGFATLFGEDGQPMHKSLGNMIEFNEGADKIGVDVMRWMYVKQNYSDNLLFGYKKADETRRFHLMLWNIYNFFVTYANIEGWSPPGPEALRGWRPAKSGLRPGGKSFKLNNVLDSWIVSRLYDTSIKVTKSLEEYKAKSAADYIEELVQDLSLWYVRRSRDRVGPGALNEKDKNDCYLVLGLLLENIAKLLAPFIPFMADAIFVNITKMDSVHLTAWPSPENLHFLKELHDTNKGLIDHMSLVRKVAEKGHSERKQKAIPVRQPLQKITVQYFKKLPSKDLLDLIKDELNVKEVQWKIKKDIVEPEVKLDTKLSPELKEEGKTRELIRRIQKERKQMGVRLAEKVNVSSPWIPSDSALIKRIYGKTFAEKLSKGEFKVRKAS